jgi:hypothetical protein
MSGHIPRDWKPLRGKFTYAHRVELAEMGARWDPETKLWWIAPESWPDAQYLIETPRERYRG